ncbi:hypothetical protein IF1G_06337 [Cordyceps javanica]|uniref:Uncharacterized protein n=1 Tax=Cordyceps javanica TaxID=43265 RepID=A0A545V0V9_9HYPO|nr:hypothetical protein IF1G_06337 [Cordyceps javanica]TQW02495.1 hypothetical protein IF2G_09886 [Cordyceps javanica]
MARLTFTLTSSILLIQAVCGATLSHSKDECPKGWSLARTQFNSQDQVYCCYGSITVENNDGYCCVHSPVLPSGQGSGNHIAGGEMTDSCFPFCSSPASQNQKRAPSSQQCIDRIPVTASDYSERVSAASSSAAASPTSGFQPSSNSASATPSASSSDFTSGGSRATGSPTANAAPVATSAVAHVGGLVAAAVMLVV